MQSLIYLLSSTKGGEWRIERQEREEGEGGQGGEGFGVGKQDLISAGAVTAPIVWCREDLWLFS